MLTRRSLLQRSSLGLGSLALGGLLGEDGLLASENPLLSRGGHFPGKAKRVIHFFLNGGPSHVDTFDYKPKLQESDGKPGQGGASWSRRSSSSVSMARAERGFRNCIPMWRNTSTSFALFAACTPTRQPILRR